MTGNFASDFCTRKVLENKKSPQQAAGYWGSKAADRKHAASCGECIPKAIQFRHTFPRAAGTELDAAGRYGMQRVFIMYNEIGAVVLGCLSATFLGYGIRELALAYKTPTLKAWSEQA